MAEQSWHIRHQGGAFSVEIDNKELPTHPRPLYAAGGQQLVRLALASGGREPFSFAQGDSLRLQLPAGYGFGAGEASVILPLILQPDEGYVDQVELELERDAGSCTIRFPRVDGRSRRVSLSLGFGADAHHYLLVALIDLVGR